MDRRIQNGFERGKSFEIEVDGTKVKAFEGETIAAALLAAGKRTTCKSNAKKEARGLYCGMGVCMGCRMIVDGKPNTLVCQTLATPDCKVKTQNALENWWASK
ncbi:MAG: (2Fe-2S)-binding protein [Chloroflexi bacterium]|nr:(2Fe-2S)-binding protein [Chloroflexota bacterium]